MASPSSYRTMPTTLLHHASLESQPQQPNPVWLRAALDFSQLLLSRSDTDPRPWAALSASVCELLDADAVVVVPASQDAPIAGCVVLGRVMALPLVGRNGSLGVIEVHRRSDQPTFSEDDAALARGLAHEVTIALELGDARAAQHRNRLLEDRERIARDLHDQVIQRLFATGLRLQSTAKASKDEADRARLTEVIDELDETVRQIRTTIFALHCSDTSTTSMRRVVLEVAESVGSAFGLRPEVCFRGPLDALVDAQVVDDVEAVVREGLTNVGKHAGAHRATVNLSATAGQLRLVIEDDGVGLTGSTRDSGMGNLRCRAEGHGGALSVDRSPMGGIRLCWTVPLR